jgi:hypothetical protein
MKILGTFEIVAESLLSIKIDGAVSHEWELLLEKWSDLEYLEEFYENNKDKLNTPFWNFKTVEEAVIETIEEAESIEKFIIKTADGENSITKANTLSDLVFKNLIRNDTSIKLTQSKAYGKERKSLLRIYAIQIAPTLYIITGGGIKLTQKMESAELLLELQKLNLTQEYLKGIGFESIEDYHLVEIYKG